MRIIAGTAGGIVLNRPPDAVRPTMDRVRGAIFSSLGDLVPAARVLDLFAGSGGMGIEALSRGATEATFVDANPKCVTCIRENLRRARLQGNLQTMDALKFVELYAREFDLIFADPPYAKRAEDRDWATDLLRLPSLLDALKPGGILVAERSPRREEPEGAVLSFVRSKRYGESEIAYYTTP